MSDCSRGYLTISEKKTALAILLGEDEDDDSTMFTTPEEFDKYLKETPLKSSKIAWGGGLKIITHIQTWLNLQNSISVFQQL